MKKKAMSVVGILILPFLLFIVFSLLTSGFGLHSVPIVLSQCMLPVTIGLAMAAVMQAGLMDFSAGARVVFGAAVGALAASSFGVVGLLVGCFVGAIVGAFVIAILYRYLKIPSMVVSMGMVLLLEVMSYKLSELSGNSGLFNITDEISAVGSYPNNILLTLIAGIIFFFIMYKTKIGCLIKAIGNDEVMAKSMGVNTDKVKFKAFVISGIFCAFGAVLLICYSASVSIQTGMITMGMVFKPMMGVMIGVQLIRIFDNMPLMIFIGELSIAIIFNGFIALGLTDNIQNIVLGAFLLIVMGISQNKEFFEEAKRKKAVRRQSASS